MVEVTGSNPVLPTTTQPTAHKTVGFDFGQLTQLGECLLDVEKVTGSSPVLPTKPNLVEPFMV